MEINTLIAENKDQLPQICQLQYGLAKQSEMKQLQIRALDRLTLLQKNVWTQTRAVRTPNPSLFINLSENGSSWNPLDLISYNFRLHLLRERASVFFSSLITLVRTDALDRATKSLKAPSGVMEACAGVQGLTFEVVMERPATFLMDEHHFRFNGPIVGDAMAFLAFY
ncbi:MAG: hypothetical protein J3Q66DRAFT_423972, partial [Benniella sp.]